MNPEEQVSNSNVVEVETRIPPPASPIPSKVSLEQIAVTDDVLSQVELVQVALGPKCATWSGNPENSDWHVMMKLSTEPTKDIDARIGFVVQSVLGKKDPHQEEETRSTKYHSRHDFVDLPIFMELLNKGDNFTKLELEGDFFSNVYLCPEEMTPKSLVLQFITLPNLKILSVKAKLSLILKGLDTETQHKYYTQHREHCVTFKRRAAQNLWYLFNALACPNLISLQIMDSMEWGDPELKNNGFYYWDQPLMTFIQRHAATLRSFKTSPIIAMQIKGENRGAFDEAMALPIIEDCLFWMKLGLQDFTPIKEHQREITYQIEVEKILRPWRQFLRAQNNLKTLIWINDVDNPWNLTRRDFVSLAEKNSKIEYVMLAVHGDEKFRKLHGLGDQDLNPKDYQIDAASVHGMTTLRILSIGCYGKDPQVKNFTFFNLHLLPGTLETIQFFGIRIMASDLESLAILPKLKSLTLIQGRKSVYKDEDEINGNIEGVTAPVLKLLLHSRTLDKLVIVGFPISASKDEMVTQKEGAPTSSTGWFGGLCGAMCTPTLEEIEESSSSPDLARLLPLASLEQYSEPLQQVITEFALMGVGKVSDVTSEEDREQIMTMLTMG